MRRKQYDEMKVKMEEMERANRELKSQVRVLEVQNMNLRQNIAILLDMTGKSNNYEVNNRKDSNHYLATEENKKMMQVNNKGCRESREMFLFNDSSKSSSSCGKSEVDDFYDGQPSSSDDNEFPCVFESERKEVPDEEKQDAGPVPLKVRIKRRIHSAFN